MCKWFRSTYSLFIHIHNVCACVCLYALKTCTSKIPNKHFTLTYVIEIFFFFSCWIINVRRKYKPPHFYSSTKIFTTQFHDSNILLLYSSEQQKTHIEISTFLCSALYVSLKAKKKNDIQSVKRIQPIKWLPWIFMWPVLLLDLMDLVFDLKI